VFFATNDISVTFDFLPTSQNPRLFRNHTWTSSSSEPTVAT